MLVLSESRIMRELSSMKGELKATFEIQDETVTKDDDITGLTANEKGGIPYYHLRLGLNAYAFYK
jgi:hypothetical protein